MAFFLALTPEFSGCKCKMKVHITLGGCSARPHVARGLSILFLPCVHEGHNNCKFPYFGVEVGRATFGGLCLGLSHPR